MLRAGEKVIGLEWPHYGYGWIAKVMGDSYYVVWDNKWLRPMWLGAEYLIKA